MRKWYIAQTYSGSESSVKNDIEARIDIIQKTIEMFNENIDELKISMDVKYSISREITIPEEKLISILEQLSFEKIYNVKGKYRKFEITNNHNITDQIMVQLFRKHINLDISINVENIVVDSENLSEEILFSSYYYIIEYAQLHYSILKELNNEYLISQQKFYPKLDIAQFNIQIEQFFLKLNLITLIDYLSLLLFSKENIPYSQ